MDTTNNTNIITQTRDIDKVTDLYFNEKYILYIHHINSFNQFINDVVKNEVERAVHILGEYEIYNDDKKEKKLYRYSFEFKNICIKPPVDDSSSYEDDILFPEEARNKSLSYSGKVLADITQYQEILIYGSNGLEENTKKVIASESKILIGKIPIMLRSAYCTTTIKKDTLNKECIYDPGCYFLIRGNEKVILSLEKICDNKMLVFTKKDINYQDKLMYTCQVNSKNNNYYNNGSYSNNLQILSIKMKKDKSIVLNMVQFTEIPIFIFFRALGIETDKDILQYILYDVNDIELLSLLEISQTAAINETIKNEKDKTEKIILTTEDATQYLLSKIKSKRIFDNTNNESKIAQKREILMTLLCRDFLPHMGLTEDKIIPKAYYLGKMVNKLLKCYLGRIPIDDRDSFVNKRIQLPGELLSDLYRRYFKKMLNECARHFKQRINGNHDNPINVINIIKSTTIEQGFNKALSIGLFGNKPGVAQALQRLSYKQTMSYFRRLMPPPSNEATTSKITTMRFPNNIQYGFIDLIETPEGANVGLQKHLALMASVSMNLDITQIDIIKNIIFNAKYKEKDQNKSYLLSLIDVIKQDIRILTHININGEWIGLTEKPIELVKLLKNKKENGEINKMASINFSFTNNTIDIYTDGGRLIRPLLRVENNKLLLTKEMLNDIDIKSINRTKITRWAEFLQKYPNVIEYVDIEESENIMVAMRPNDVIDNYNKMNLIIEKPNKFGDPSNRYNDTIYVKYTHCEFHPMMMMGAISATVPFAEHNQAPRNYYSYSQSRQGMGIYLSSYRYRIDLSTILYHPERPLVTSKAGYYTNVMDLPSGQNLVVAIMCYTGYNQEDSVIVNKSFTERGGFRSTSLKGYSDTVNKNTSTGQDEKFMKPNDNIATGIKEANYSKLNDQGFVPEETIIYNNDIIIGKCAPIQPTATNNKIFKDESQTYKSNVPGVVDKVYTGILNGDGYETYNMRIRSERIPIIGDKMACYDDSHDVLTFTGWKNIKDITLDDKIASLSKDNTLIYVKPTEVMNYDYEGPMYNVETNQISLNVTPNHRMWIGDREGNNFKIVEARDLVAKRVKYQKNVDNYIPTNGMKEFIIPGVNDLPELKLNMKAWLIFFGIWIAEGYMSHDWAIEFAAHKQRVKDALEECSEILGFKIRKYKGNKDIDIYNYWCYTDKRLVNFFKPLSLGAINKFLPDWIWQLDTYQCRNLLHGMLLGDGHTMVNGTKRYDTSSSRLADDFQRLCLHCGYSANRAIKYKAGKVSTIVKGERIGETITSTVDAYRLTIIETQNYPLVNKNIVKSKLNDNGQYENQLDSMNDGFKGKVYCCTVPTELGVIYIRRNYITIWSGNSSMGQKGTAGILLPQQDMPFTKDGIRPDIIINPCCFVGSTLVSLTNGLSKRIDSFSEQGLEKVYTFDNNGLINSYSLGMESRGIKDTIKLTLLDGRELICTPDHKFKVKAGDEYIYKEAKDLIINKDNLVTSIEFTEDINYNDENEWNFMIGYYKFNMLTEENRNKSLALGRILGYVYSENNYMDTLLDINNFIYDIYLVTGIQTNILYKINTTGTSGDNKFYTNIPEDLLQDLYKLKTINNIPTLILSHDTPKSFIREYIATYLSYNKIDEFIKQIVLKFSDIYNDINYLKYIGYRYNINKSLDLSLHVSYLRYCKYNNIIEKNTYLKLINADKINITKNMNYIPCWLNKVNSIEQNGQLEVFDIGVANHNNFCADGVVISNCIPSRMTIAQLIESIFAKVGALRGETMDGTPFSNIDIDSVSKMLKDYGFDENGYEEMYCGMTGKKLHSKIFIAPTHYMRLKHMVQDKIHCLTPDHDVYTKFGWKLITEITNDDLIATLTKDKTIEYYKPNKIYRYENYNGEMYEIKNDYVELNVTINHRMLLNNNNELELVKASELIGDKSNIYLDGNYKNVLVNDFDTRIYNYNGCVICLEVPNETFLVRKNNKTVWTGNSRAGTGPRQKLTRQPPEGRAKNGGHRFGEMERDAMIAHGCALFLKERMVDTSDIYITFVCNKCGLLANKLSDKDVWKCNQCNDNPEVSKIAIPYAFKLLVQELMAINILPRIKVEQDN